MNKGMVKKALLIGVGVVIYKLFISPKVRSMLP